MNTFQLKLHIVLYQNKQYQKDESHPFQIFLNDFFKKELEAYLTPELNPIGREIIEAFMNDAPLKKYEEIMEKYMEENK